VLQQKGFSKKSACDILSEKYGRGYWSISNIVGNNHILKKTASLFD
jgi:hypothetical protein